MEDELLFTSSTKKTWVKKIFKISNASSFQKEFGIFEKSKTICLVFLKSAAPGVIPLLKVRAHLPPVWEVVGTQEHYFRFSFVGEINDWCFRFFSFKNFCVTQRFSWKKRDHLSSKAWTSFWETFFVLSKSIF